MFSLKENRFKEVKENKKCHIKYKTKDKEVTQI